MPDVIQIAIQAVDTASKVIGGVGDSLDRLGKQSEEADKKLKLFSLSTEQIGQKMTQAGKIATVGLTVPIAGLAVAATKAASDLNETSNKIQTLFGNATGAVMKFADTASTSLGQSKKQALDAAADFAVFGRAAGLAGNDLVKFSKESVTLAADMASFFNTSPEEAITAIGAAFRGESEPIRRYGVLLDDASLKQQALKMGLIKTTTEALQPQARVLAAQALILQQTSAAQGDFAKTSGGLANQSRILNAQFQDMIAALGQSLLPIAVKVTGAANDLLTAFNNLDQSQKDLIVGFGLMAAAAGPVLTIGGKLISVYGRMRSVSIDAVGGFITFGKTIGETAGYLKTVGISADSLKFAFQNLKASGALLGVELGVIAIGLIAIGKYLEEVGNAAKASSEDLIAMSRSGDVFKQAAATTEIFANGQDRLKAALDGTHEKIKAGTKEYADYKSAIDATAKAAGYEINAQGDLIQVFYGVGGRIERVIEAHYRLSKAQYDAVPGANQLVAVWNKLVGVGQQFIDIVAPQVNYISPLAKGYDVLGAAIDRAKTSAMKANPAYVDGADALAKLKIAMAGDIKKETDKFGESQKSLQERLKETSDELRNLQREQGGVDKSTTKNAMSSAQLAAAQANLAAAQARLAKETDPIKQQQLAASIAVQQEKIAGANQAVVTYVDNSKRIAELKGQYDELNKEIAANAAAHEEATRRILFGYAEQQLAQGTLTQQEADALNKLAVQWGLKSQADVNAFRAVDEALSAFAKNADIDAFANKLDRISDKALGIKITPQIDYKNLRESKTEKALAVTVTPKLDPKKVKTDATELLNSKEMKKLGEPVIIPIRADTSTATVNMRYFNDYGLSPAIVYYDALIQRAGLFNTVVGQTPTLPTIPGYTPPTAPAPQPVRPPGTGPVEFAAGGNFIVPSGYPNDSFQMGVSSGERVQVTPAGRGGNNNTFNISQTFNGAQGEPEQYKKIMYEVISDVFENVNAARK